MESAPFLSPLLLLAAFTSGMVLYGLWIKHIISETMMINASVFYFFSDITGLEPGAVGLALSYAVTLTGMFQWGVRQSAEIENMVGTTTFEHLTAVYILIAHH